MAIFFTVFLNVARIGIELESATELIKILLQSAFKQDLSSTGLSKVRTWIAISVLYSLNKGLMNTIALAFIVIFSTSLRAQPHDLCTSLFNPILDTDVLESRSKIPKTQSLDSTGQTKINPVLYEDLASTIENNAIDFKKILLGFENETGAQYEIQQVLQTLRGVRAHELNDLENSEGIQNVAVYGSTNIPLYTLILHAVIPASTGAQVWFRTPQGTRAVYVRLFELLQAKHSSFPWDKIHLLTEKRDVQYDNFRKMYVLGLNLNGTRFLRNPSEVVLFTGNPKTGDEILAANKKKIKELMASGAAKDLNSKQIFLKFGSGLNPVVITASAQGDVLQQAVVGTVTAVRINSSQDCIAPKVYFVHSDAKANYFQILMEKLNSLRFGSNSDPTADYGPITFTENFSKLNAFREKYKRFLINQNAVIDPITKQVDPHVFVIPFSEFKNMELTDHFAPFLVHVTFSNDAEFSMIATDKRVSDRAMFASVYATPSSKDLVVAKTLFEDSLHLTIINQSVFADENGNIPFGGFSENASSVTKFLIQNLKLFESTSVRPLLFSAEVHRSFPKN